MTDATIALPVKKVLLLGATGTIGRATARALVDAGHETVCVVRHGSAGHTLPMACQVRQMDVTDAKAIAHGISGERFDAVISCLASRTGVPGDAWSIDHGANMAALAAAKAASIPHFIVLSAICVQKPHLAFQHAKLAFEAVLKDSGLLWTIVRPTAFFKSLSGQVDRVNAGKPFMVFGDGRLTACKPISDRDLAVFLVACLTDADRQNRVIPIGGPGPAITPLDQATYLFDRLGRPSKITKVSPSLLSTVAGILGPLGMIAPTLAEKAALARIGHYYATESMLVWDEAAKRYDAGATPETGSDTLFRHYDRLIAGTAADDRGAHAVF